MHRHRRVRIALPWTWRTSRGATASETLLTDWRNWSRSKKRGPKNSSVYHEKSWYIWGMPVWDVPAGDEMGPRPGAQGLNRTRHKATGRLEIYARPHKIDFSWWFWIALGKFSMPLGDHYHFKIQTQVWNLNLWCCNFTSSVCNFTVIFVVKFCIFCLKTFVFFV